MSPQTTYHTSSSLIALARARGLCGCLLLVAVAIFGVASGHADSIPLHSFNVSDGANPFAGLMQASDGNFYGTTVSGGANGQGTIFKITSSGSLTTLYSFSGGNDGANPHARLIQASDGDLYGTASARGAGDAGTVFKITLSGSLTTLYSFNSGDDGGLPYAGLVQGSDGNFYGTTVFGGPSKRGTIFQITASGILTTLHSFNFFDGENPFAGLVQGSDGDFYGTTATGAGGQGRVFKITSSGSFTTLHNFNYSDGADVEAGLVQGSDGEFYGTTNAGGANSAGTVFKITSGGSLTTLYNFNNTDGSSPIAALVQASEGNFYGTTAQGGASNSGTVFKVTSGGILTTLYDFSGADGAVPYGALVQGSDGNFYGTTNLGGANGAGTVFKIVPMVSPTNADQCKNDGWKTFTNPRTFKNQGDCIQFVNTGK